MGYQHQILGTIISSVLNYDQLTRHIDEPQAVNPATSSYVPCDGRSIAGSKLAQLTGRQNIPDLRGKFARGLNQFYSVGEPTPFDPVIFGDTQSQRTVGDFQGDEIGPHSHQMNFNLGRQPGWSGGWGGDGNVRAVNSPGDPGNDHHPEPNGGMETRPRNIAVYFYIKIN
jgi:hypothetical protein